MTHLSCWGPCSWMWTANHRAKNLGSKAVSVLQSWAKKIKKWDDFYGFCQGMASTLWRMNHIHVFTRWTDFRQWHNPWRIHGDGIYANMTGVYWWDPWSTIYSIHGSVMGKFADRQRNFTSLLKRLRKFYINSVCKCWQCVVPIVQFPAFSDLGGFQHQQKQALCLPTAATPRRSLNHYFLNMCL